jgi:hypothetical protein
MGGFKFPAQDFFFSIAIRCTVIKKKDGKGDVEEAR